MSRYPGLGVGVLLLTAACRHEPTPDAALATGDADALAATLAFFATRPVYERPLATGLEPVPGVAGLSAAACGACHREIYEAWRVSTHAAAWVDPQFQGEIRKSDNRWLCRNCHTPLLVQQPQWPTGLFGDDVERPALLDNRDFDDALQQEGITCAACHVVDGVVHGPGRAVDTAAHPVVADARFRSEALCVRCHQAVATYEGKSFVCTFETGEEWRAGPYDEAGTDCRDCHMPGGRHGWRGAGIPKFAGLQPPLQDEPPGLGLVAGFAGDVLEVTATNARAGHRLPTGDPERWVAIDVTFTGAGGVAVGEAWSHRIGQVWTWSPPERISDNRLAPRQSRVLPVPVPVGATAATVVASSHRMTAESAAYHQLDGYPLSVETHRLVLQRPR